MKSFHRRSSRPAADPAARDRVPVDRGDQVRIDVLLVGRGWAPSRAAAQRLIDAGVVFVDGEVVRRPSRTVNMKCCVAVEKVD